MNIGESTMSELMSFAEEIMDIEMEGAQRTYRDQEQYEGELVARVTNALKALMKA